MCQFLTKCLGFVLALLTRSVQCLADGVGLLLTLLKGRRGRVGAVLQCQFELRARVGEFGALSAQRFEIGLRVAERDGGVI